MINKKKLERPESLALNVIRSVRKIRRMFTARTQKRLVINKSIILIIIIIISEYLYRIKTSVFYIIFTVKYNARTAIHACPVKSTSLIINNY